MKVIIAGGRKILRRQFDEAMVYNPFEVTTVISGTAKGEWAIKHKIPYVKFPAKWFDFTEGIIAKRKHVNGGYYNAAAGLNRNEEMAKNADALILIWDGKSSGSTDMFTRAISHNLAYFSYNVVNGNYEIH